MAAGIQPSVIFEDAISWVLANF